VNRRHQVSYLFRTTGEVLGVSLSAALTQTLLVRELRMRIVSDGADEVCRLMFFSFQCVGPSHFNPALQIIAKILASTEYIHTLPTMLQEKAAASWMCALHTVFQCQMVRRIPFPEIGFQSLQPMAPIFPVVLLTRAR
jgi:hypothetical protein